MIKYIENYESIVAIYEVHVKPRSLYHDLIKSYRNILLYVWLKFHKNQIPVRRNVEYESKQVRPDFFLFFYKTV